MNIGTMLKRPAVIITLLALVVCIILGVLAYRLVIMPSTAAIQATPAPTSTLPPVIPSATPPPVESPAKALGIETKSNGVFSGISWVRLSYPSCGWGNLTGKVLKETIQFYHTKGVRVLLTICQGHDDDSLYNTQPLKDAAQGLADAVQCGNEQMKQDASVTFLRIAPEHFAKFYDLCITAIHAVRPDIPVILGSLDPHVVSLDQQQMAEQVQYLDQMQTAMNTIVHPGGHWSWRSAILGLIDSWHNGYPNASTNNLLDQFNYWAKEFKLDLNSGHLGEHLWVVEGTGCFKGCGVNTDDSAAVAISHTLTLITDVQTTMKYQVPFFFFSDRDFDSVGYHWPIGVLDEAGNPKPIRQDLTMGARTLNMTCTSSTVSVTDQELLLANLYAGCTLPNNYINIISS